MAHEKNKQTEDYDIEMLRQSLIRELEAAYFGGIGPALAEIAAAKYAGNEELFEMARRWGII